jgi:hypothetical protein
LNHTKQHLRIILENQRKNECCQIKGCENGIEDEPVLCHEVFRSRIS